MYAARTRLFMLTAVFAAVSAVTGFAQAQKEPPTVRDFCVKVIPGKGAEFEVVLPTIPPSDVAEPRPLTKHTPIQSRRVLVIEDNRDAADSLCEVLDLLNHSATVAYSGDEGLKKVRAHRPDVVLCDIGLPGMDGHEVARAIRADASLSATTLVALTGYAAPEDLARSQEAGFDFHLAKPPSIEAIERVLAEVKRRDPQVEK